MLNADDDIRQQLARDRRDAQAREIRDAIRDLRSRPAYGRLSQGCEG